MERKIPFIFRQRNACKDSAFQLTVIPPNCFPGAKMAHKKIDSIRRSFLSRGEALEKVSGGHSLINWPTTCLPKIKGGLGILDLERFTRALRLRWLWFRWKQKHRAWNNLDVPCDKTDRELFYASSIVTIGDGRAALSGVQVG